MQWQCLRSARPSAFRTRRCGGLITTAAAVWWLLEGTGAALQHVLTASTVTYDQSEHCPILYTYDVRAEPGLICTVATSQAIGGGPSGPSRERAYATMYELLFEFTICNCIQGRGLSSVTCLRGPNNCRCGLLCASEPRRRVRRRRAACHNLFGFSIFYGRG